ncbi:DUF2975 domain-containing protein [Pseudarthrobacter sp. MM222]|uniref:DUF2975 domain-containing protein n=1 Tax=Pseudarthrobacter sp. MM222 TaxID=3018929 RepID=UPI002220D087|nr:DUF2975 domain-containing protein [Pseudarthrobacter sp. MM222]CAI3799315.1 hypothetical protein NKCBBBOE_02295 [Pseudarthrobacter sp. MM222]
MKASATKTLSGKRNIISGIDAVFLMLAAALVAAVTTVMTIIGILNLSAGSTTLRLPADLARDSFQPAPRIAADAVVSGRFTEMEVTMNGVPAPEAVLLAWSAVLNQVCILAVAALVIFLCLRMRRERLFTSAAVWAIGLCGAALAVTGSAAQILSGTGRGLLAERLTDATNSGEAVYVTDFNFGTLIAGLVMVLFAGVFRFGRRLQQDTDGLV